MKKFIKIAIITLVLFSTNIFSADPDPSWASGDYTLVNGVAGFAIVNEGGFYILKKHNGTAWEDVQDGQFKGSKSLNCLADDYYGVYMDCYAMDESNGYETCHQYYYYDDSGYSDEYLSLDYTSNFGCDMWDEYNETTAANIISFYQVFYSNYYSEQTAFPEPFTSESGSFGDDSVELNGVYDYYLVKENNKYLLKAYISGLDKLVTIMPDEFYGTKGIGCYADKSDYGTYIDCYALKEVDGSKYCVNYYYDSSYGEDVYENSVDEFGCYAYDDLTEASAKGEFTFFKSFLNSSWAEGTIIPDFFANESGTLGENHVLINGDENYAIVQENDQYVLKTVAGDKWVTIKPGDFNSTLAIGCLHDNYNTGAYLSCYALRENNGQKYCSELYSDNSNDPEGSLYIEYSTDHGCNMWNYDTNQEANDFNSFVVNLTSSPYGQPTLLSGDLSPNAIPPKPIEQYYTNGEIVKSKTYFDTKAVVEFNDAPDGENKYQLLQWDSINGTWVNYVEQNYSTAIKSKKSISCADAQTQGNYTCYFINQNGFCVEFYITTANPAISQTKSNNESCNFGKKQGYTDLYSYYNDSPPNDSFFVGESLPTPAPAPNKPNQIEFISDVNMGVALIMHNDRYTIEKYNISNGNWEELSTSVKGVACIPTDGFERKCYSIKDGTCDLISIHSESSEVEVGYYPNEACGVSGSSYKNFYNHFTTINDGSLFYLSTLDPDISRQEPNGKIRVSYYANYKKTGFFRYVLETSPNGLEWSEPFKDYYLGPKFTKNPYGNPIQEIFTKMAYIGCKLPDGESDPNNTDNRVCHIVRDNYSCIEIIINNNDGSIVEQPRDAGITCNTNSMSEAYQSIKNFNMMLPDESSGLTHYDQSSIPSTIPTAPDSHKKDGSLRIAEYNNGGEISRFIEFLNYETGQWQQIPGSQGETVGCRAYPNSNLRTCMSFNGTSCNRAIIISSEAFFNASMPKMLNENTYACGEKSIADAFNLFAENNDFVLGNQIADDPSKITIGPDTIVDVDADKTRLSYYSNYSVDDKSGKYFVLEYFKDNSWQIIPDTLPVNMNPDQDGLMVLCNKDLSGTNRVCYILNNQDTCTEVSINLSTLDVTTNNIIDKKICGWNSLKSKVDLEGKQYVLPPQQ